MAGGGGGGSAAAAARCCGRRLLAAVWRAPRLSHPHSQYWMARSVTSSSVQHSGHSSSSSESMVAPPAPAVGWGALLLSVASCWRAQEQRAAMLPLAPTLPLLPGVPAPLGGDLHASVCAGGRQRGQWATSGCMATWRDEGWEFSCSLCRAPCTATFGPARPQSLNRQPWPPQSPSPARRPRSPAPPWP